MFQDELPPGSDLDTRQNHIEADANKGKKLARQRQV
jgi:hypothetical protein